MPRGSAQRKSGTGGGGSTPPPRLQNAGTLFQVFRQPPVLPLTASPSPEASSKDIRRSRSSSQLSRKSKSREQTANSSLADLLNWSSDDSSSNLKAPSSSARGSSNSRHAAAATQSNSPTSVSASAVAQAVARCTCGPKISDFWSVVGSSSVGSSSPHKAWCDGSCKRRRSKARYECPVCGMSFTQAGSRNSHLKVVHYQERKYRCSVDGCERAFGHRGDLTRHIQEVHARCRLYSCDKCGRQFTRNYALCRHIRAKHPK